MSCTHGSGDDKQTGHIHKRPDDGHSCSLPLAISAQLRSLLAVLERHVQPTLTDEGEELSARRRVREDLTQVSLDGLAVGDLGVEGDGSRTQPKLVVHGSVEPGHLLRQLLHARSERLIVPPFGLVGHGVVDHVGPEVDVQPTPVLRFPRLRPVHRRGRRLVAPKQEEPVLAGRPADRLQNVRLHRSLFGHGVEKLDLQAVARDVATRHAVELHDPATERQDLLAMGILVELAGGLVDTGDRSVEAEPTLTLAHL